ncbi:aspartyl/asparaginyl beta-hydroxylase domain-containing protein [Azospirillum melinis]
MDHAVQQAGEVGSFPHPWQRISAGSGLTLHAAADLRLDAAMLQAEFAGLDAALTQDQRGHYQNGLGEGWTSIPLLDQPREGSSSGRKGMPRPSLDFMPSLRALLDQPGWVAWGCDILRQSAYGTLAWHSEPQALHLEHFRLLIPIHAPAGAVTLLGHEAAAYPEGQAWSGDFCFPHQVENLTDRDRIVIAIDLLVTPEIRALFPAALTENVQLRTALAAEANRSMRDWLNELAA